METIIQQAETYEIIGLCMNVHRELGFGFSEIVYKDALEIEALDKSIPVLREREFSVHYKNIPLKHCYVTDFVMFDNIIVEIKTNPFGIIPDHIAQTLNYLKVSTCRGD
jgi:GxxExxY protein